MERGVPTTHLWASRSPGFPSCPASPVLKIHVSDLFQLGDAFTLCAASKPRSQTAKWGRLGSRGRPSDVAHGLCRFQSGVWRGMTPHGMAETPGMCTWHPRSAPQGGAVPTRGKTREAAGGAWHCGVLTMTVTFPLHCPHRCPLRVLQPCP